MNIIYSIDDSYSEYMAVSIYSLCINNKDSELMFYILDNGISKENKILITAMVESLSAESKVNKSVFFIKTDKKSEKIGEDLKAKISVGDFNMSAFMRIFATDLLPAVVDRFLYLDSDTIVLRDIKKLYDMDLNENICAMALEPSIYEKLKAELGLKEDEPYFNSGVMLVDRGKWEEENIKSKCVEAISENKGLYFPDQNVLNLCLRGKVKPLNQEYNFFSNYYYRKYEDLCKCAPRYSTYIDKKSYDKALKKPVIVHFAGAERPWIKGNHNPYRGEYERFKAKTPYKDSKPIGGKRLYMIFYHLINILSAHVPGLRKAVGSMYYNKIIKRRAKT